MSFPKTCPMCGADMSESGQCTRPENHSIIRRSSEFSDFTQLSERESKEMVRRIEETGYAFDVSQAGVLQDNPIPACPACGEVKDWNNWDCQKCKYGISQKARTAHASVVSLSELPADLQQILHDRDELRAEIELDDSPPDYLSRDDHRIGD